MFGPFMICCSNHFQTLAQPQGILSDNAKSVRGIRHHHAPQYRPGPDEKVQYLPLKVLTISEAGTLMKDDKISRSWEDFLNPDVLQLRLISASVYIAGFELLKDSIIDRIRDFFCIGFNEKGDVIDPEYESDMLGRNKSPLYASLDWLKQMNAIDDSDIKSFEGIKNCRNLLAHQLHTILWKDGLPADFEKRFQDMVALLHKIELWWIINVEIATNPDFDGQNIDKAEVLPGPVIALQLLSDIALGSDEQRWSYLREFRKLSRKGAGSS